MLNEATLIGNVGSEVEVKHFDNGGVVANFSFATNKTYKDKSGEKKTDTQWHKICIWGKKAEIAEQYVKKGDKLFLRGEITYRSYESDGTTKYITEIVLGQYDGEMKMLSSKSEGGSNSAPPPPPPEATASDPETGEELPF